MDIVNRRIFAGVSAALAEARVGTLTDTALRLERIFRILRWGKNADKGHFKNSDHREAHPHCVCGSHGDAVLYFENVSLKLKVDLSVPLTECDYGIVVWETAERRSRVSAADPVDCWAFCATGLSNTVLEVH